MCPFVEGLKTWSKKGFCSGFDFCKKKGSLKQGRTAWVIEMDVYFFF